MSLVERARELGIRQLHAEPLEAGWRVSVVHPDAKPIDLTEVADSFDEALGLVLCKLEGRVA